MWDPTTFPFVRAQTYADRSAPVVLSDEFYNPVQDNLGWLFGALAGQSASIATDDFDIEGGPVSTVGSQVGTDFTIISIANAQAFSLAAVQAGECGVWNINGTGGAQDLKMADASCAIGAANRFNWTARVQVLNRALLDNSTGAVVGLGDLSVFNYPAFIADGLHANWQVFSDAGAADSGIPVASGAWIWLWIARAADGITRWYVKRDADPVPLLVASMTLPDNAFTTHPASRFLRFKTTAPTALAIDMYARAVER
jgi:hypothetical protein